MGRSHGKQIVAEDAAYKKLLANVGEAVLGIKELCRQHGIFDGLRELFKCTQCGLMEDVSCGGRLLTYHDIDNPVDSGLRFAEPDDDGYSRCPGCGEAVRLEEGDDE